MHWICWHQGSYITDSLDLIFLVSAYTYTNITCEQQYVTVQGVDGVASHPPWALQLHSFRSQLRPDLILGGKLFIFFLGASPQTPNAKAHWVCFTHYPSKANMSNPMFLNSAAMVSVKICEKWILKKASHPSTYSYVYHCLQSLPLHGILHRNFNTTYIDSSIPHT